jgi:hypothetical protein
MSHTRATLTRTLGAELERDRLEHRVRRLAVAIAVLRERAREHRRELGGAPLHIRQAIADFEAQLADTNARLRYITDNRGSIEAAGVRQTR